MCCTPGAAARLSSCPHHGLSHAEVGLMKKVTWLRESGERSNASAFAYSTARSCKCHPGHIIRPSESTGTSSSIQLRYCSTRLTGGRLALQFDSSDFDLELIKSHRSSSVEFAHLAFLVKVSRTGRRENLHWQNRTARQSPGRQVHPVSKCWLWAWACHLRLRCRRRPMLPGLS